MKTLIIIDVQNDFIPGGSLAVPEGDKIVRVINEIQAGFDLVVATQDWHPPNHRSFASNHQGKKEFDKIILHDAEQVLWPDHCVQGSSGAEFHPDLELNRVEAIFRKGMNPEIDSYSGFYDNHHKRSTGLAGYLREKGAEELWFCGLAADICVYFTIQDALKENFKTHLLIDGTKPLDQQEFDAQLGELKKDGVNFLTAKEAVE